MDNENTALVLIELPNEAKHLLRKYVRSCGLSYNEFSALTFQPVDRKKKMLTAVVGVRVSSDDIQGTLSKIVNYLKLKDPTHCEYIYVRKIMSYCEETEALKVKKKELMKEYQVKGWE